MEGEETVRPELEIEADPEALKALDARIARAREKLAPERPAPGWRGGKFAGVSLAWRMVLELMIGVALGGLIGWALDSALGFFPLMTAIFGGLGFAAGVKTMLRSAKEADNSARRG